MKGIFVFSMICRATTLLPRSRITSGGGPINAMPAFSQAAEKSGFAVHTTALFSAHAALMTWSDLFPLNLYWISNYNKTAQVLVALRAVLGDSTFHRALIEYGNRWTGRHPDLETVDGTME
jgi:hypothetical protein